MISNERPSPYGHHRPFGTPKPPVNEDTLKSDKIQIERKTFVFTLKENPRGRFLRITEDVAGRRAVPRIPAQPAVYADRRAAAGAGGNSRLGKTAIFRAVAGREPQRG